MPVNPTSKTWDLVNEGGAAGSTDNVVGGGGGGGGSDPTTLPLINGWDTNVFSYDGAFRIRNDAGVSMYNTERYAIANSVSDPTKLWIVACRDAGKANFHVVKLSIPELVSDPMPSNMNLPTVDSVAFNVATNSETGIRVSTDSYPRSIFEVSGKLIIVQHATYPGPNNIDHIVVLDDISDIENSNIRGYFECIDGNRSAGWFGDIPTEWQSLLGYSHFMGASHIDSITNRSSVGPSFYGVNINDILLGTGGDVIANDKFISYPLGPGTRSIANTVYPTTNMLNADDSVNGPSIGNDLFTFQTPMNGGFIVPGTRTYLCLGAAAGMGNAPVTGLDSWIDYGREYALGLDGTPITIPKGYGSILKYDSSPFFMMFDLNDILSAKNGEISTDDVAPYSWGRIPESEYFPNFIPEGKTRDDVNKSFCYSFNPNTNEIWISQAKIHWPGAYNGYPIVQKISISI